MSAASTNNNTTSSSNFRVNYSDYVANITGSPKATRQSTATTGIGHHINPLLNPYPNRQNQPTQQTGAMPQYGGGSDKCARCSKTVYIAEKKVGAGRSFHSSCFNCNTCHRKLDSSALSEHKGEIYCKPCYTKQFGAHGLISGVTMSTEQTTREHQGTRRSSHGDDLDTPGVLNQQTRQRTYSNENVFRDEYSTRQNDTSPKKSPQRNNNVVPEQNSPSKKINAGANALVDINYRRSPSPSRVDDSNVNENRHQSTYIEEDDRSKYIYGGPKISYGGGASAVVDIPVVIHNKKPNVTVNRFEVPTEPVRGQQRSRSPSVTSNDSYQRQSSRERITDPADEYSRLTINEDNSNRKYSKDNSLNTIISENPATSTKNYSYSSTYESKRQSTTSNTTNLDHEQYHSRDSSPSSKNYRNQSPSPVRGHVSSTAGYSTSTTYRTEASPSPSHPPQYNYRNTEIPSNSPHTNRRSPSPQSNNRSSSDLTDFIAKTNIAGNSVSPNANKSSALGALANSFRPQSKSTDDDDWAD